MYLKVKRDLCPKCGAGREIIVQGMFETKGKWEQSQAVIGWKCRCGSSQPAELKQGLDRVLPLYNN